MCVPQFSRSLPRTATAMAVILFLFPSFLHPLCVVHDDTPIHNNRTPKIRPYTYTCSIPTYIKGFSNNILVLRPENPTCIRTYMYILCYYRIVTIFLFSSVDKRLNTTTIASTVLQYKYCARCNIRQEAAVAPGSRMSAVAVRLYVI